MLIFELFEKSHEDSEPTVSISFQIATPDQIRGATRLTEEAPPSRTVVALPGCGGLLHCPLSNFTAIVLKAVRAECVGIPELETWVNKIRPELGHSSLTLSTWSLIGGAIAIVLVTSLLVVPLTLYLRPHRKHTTRSSSYEPMLAPGDVI